MSPHFAKPTSHLLPLPKTLSVICKDSRFSFASEALQLVCVRITMPWHQLNRGPHLRHARSQQPGRSLLSLMVDKQTNQPTSQSNQQKQPTTNLLAMANHSGLRLLSLGLEQQLPTDVEMKPLGGTRQWPGRSCWEVESNGGTVWDGESTTGLFGSSVWKAFWGFY